MIVVELPCSECETYPTHVCIGFIRCEAHCSIPMRHFAQEEARQEVPQPSVAARPIPRSGWSKLPTSPQRAALAAESAGWQTVVTEACGPALGLDGDLLEADVWTLAVKAQQPGRIVAMLWAKRSGTWKFSRALATGHGSLRHDEARALLEEG